MQPKFVVGKSEKSESSSESEDEYENSIFQPNVAIEATSMHYSTDNSGNSTDKNDSYIEEGVELTENTNLFETGVLDPITIDTYLPGVGIVMGATNETAETPTAPVDVGNTSNVDNVRLSSVVHTISIKNTDINVLNSTPAIHINEEETKVCPPTTLKLNRKLSRSSSDIDNMTENKKDFGIDPNSIYVAGDCHFDKRSNSEQDITLNISQSQSESALKNKLVNLTSPVATVTKDLVLNPFSKLAKGVQNFGSNLDPRKFSMGGIRHISERELEEHRQMQEKWRQCNTRLIAL